MVAHSLARSTFEKRSFESEYTAFSKVAWFRARPESPKERRKVKASPKFKNWQETMFLSSHRRWSCALNFPKAIFQSLYER